LLLSIVLIVLGTTTHLLVLQLFLWCHVLVYYLTNRNIKLQCLFNNFMYYVLLQPWIMMLIIITTPYWHMAYHPIIMGDWIIVNCKIQWYFWLTNFTSQIYIINTKWKNIYIIPQKLASFHIDYIHKIMIAHGMLMSFTII